MLWACSGTLTVQHAATRHVHAKTKRPDSVSKCMAISLRTAIIWHIQSTQSNFPGVFATGSCDSFFENQTIKQKTTTKQTKQKAHTDTHRHTQTHTHIHAHTKPAKNQQRKTNNQPKNKKNKLNKKRQPGQTKTTMINP